MYERKVEASHSKPSGNLWCKGINFPNIKFMKKFTELHFMPCLWVVFFIFKVMSILQYCSLSLVWQSLLIYPLDFGFVEWHGYLKDNIQTNVKEVVQASSVAYRGGFRVFKPPPPEIPKISVESSIAWARRTGVSISFCSSLCSHTVVIY